MVGQWVLLQSVRRAKLWFPQTSQNQSPGDHFCSSGACLRQLSHRMTDRKFSDSQPGHCHTVSSPRGGDRERDRPRGERDRERRLGGEAGTPELQLELPDGRGGGGEAELELELPDGRGGGGEAKLELELDLAPPAMLNCSAMASLSTSSGVRGLKVLPVVVARTPELAAGPPELDPGGEEGGRDIFFAGRGIFFARRGIFFAGVDPGGGFGVDPGGEEGGRGIFLADGGGKDGGFGLNTKGSRAVPCPRSPRWRSPAPPEHRDTRSRSSRRRSVNICSQKPSVTSSSRNSRNLCLSAML